MIVPTIHPNSTSKEILLQELKGASEALNKALLALRNTAPNGRDYSPNGYYNFKTTLKTVTEEHSSRLRRVDEVKDETDNLILAIDQQT